MLASLTLLVTLVALGSCEEMVTSKAYTDYLKRHVDWEVSEYEDNVFRGWTLEEAKELLVNELPIHDSKVPTVEPIPNLPRSLDWREKSNCVHEHRDQKNCGSAWAIAVAGMLSDRCCLQGSDHGWLSAQELVSCDSKSHGCSGGWCSWALDYVIGMKGLADESCCPYQAQNLPCSCRSRCPHQCNCVGGYKKCIGVESIQTCLQGGTITIAFGVCQSLYSYKSGIYKCDCQQKYVGLHAVSVVGYGESPECHWICRNSWSIGWGEQGYLKLGCSHCDSEGAYDNGNTVCPKVGSG